jgi:hypothetical protein
VFVLTYGFGLGAETGQLVVAPARPPANMRTSTRGGGGAMNMLDQWAQFFANADGSVEIVGVSAAEGVAAAIFVDKLCPGRW